MTFPAPVINVAIEPKTKADQDKLGTAIQRLAEEDPTFQVRTDEETGQTIISGMGELHLEVLVDRMKREFRVEANIGRPQVAYRETVRRKVGEGRVHPQEADRWLRPVRQGPDQPGADRRRRRRLRVREQDHRWPDPARVHPVGGRRLPGGGGVRRAGRLPDGGREGDPHRRRLPRGGLLRARLQDRRLDGLQEGGSARRPRAPRAGDGGRGPDSRRLHGRRHRRPEQPPWPDPGDGGAVRGPGRPGARAAVGDVRLRRRPAQQDAGPGGLHACSSTLTPRCRRISPRRSSRRLEASNYSHDNVRSKAPRQGAWPPSTGGEQRGDFSGEGQVRADQAAREHRHHRAHRPRQDDADRGDHQGAARQVPRREPLHALRPDRQREGREGARDHHLDLARRVPDRASVTTLTWTALVTPTTSRT